MKVGDLVKFASEPKGKSRVIFGIGVITKVNISSCGDVEVWWPKIDRSRMMALSFLEIVSASR